METALSSLFLITVAWGAFSLQTRRDKCTGWNTDGTDFLLTEVKQSIMADLEMLLT